MICDKKNLVKNFVDKKLFIEYNTCEGNEIFMIDIKKYEAVAMLDLSDDESDRLCEIAGAMAKSFERLEKIDTRDVSPLVSVIDRHTVLREDIVQKSLTRDEILANAPEQSDGYFRVPGTLE